MDATDCPICNRVGGPLVECTVCHQRKSPRGRSAPLASSYCGYDCPGYVKDPRPGELWPGERYGDSLGHMDWHEERVRLDEYRMGWLAGASGSLRNRYNADYARGFADGRNAAVGAFARERAAIAADAAGGE